MTAIDDDGTEPLPVEAFRRSTLRPLDIADAEARLPPWTRELIACLSTRARTAFVLRQTGTAFAQIGLYLGVSSSRAGQLCAAAERRLVATARSGVLRRHRHVEFPHECPPGAALCPVLARARESLDLPIDALDLSVRSHCSLENRNVVLIGQLVQLSQAQLLKVPNLGSKSLREIIAALARFGLHPSMDVAGWRPGTAPGLPPARQLRTRSGLPADQPGQAADEPTNGRGGTVDLHGKMSAW